MKKILPFILSACLVAVFASCNKDTSVDIIGGSDGPTSIIISDNDGKAPVVAGAAIYRGTIGSITDTDDGKIFYIKEYLGRDFGSPELYAKFSDNTQTSTPEEPFAVGDYVELYYGPTESSSMENPVNIISIGNLGKAEERVHNGKIKEISEKDGYFSMVDHLTEETIIVHYDLNGKTQMYFNESDFLPGYSVSVFHSRLLADNDKSGTKAVVGEELSPFVIKD